MTLTRRTLGVAALTGAVVLAGCSGTSGRAVGPPQGAERPIALAVVPGQDLGLICVPEVQETFQDKGLRLTVTEVTGPDVVQDVVSKKGSAGQAGLSQEVALSLPNPVFASPATAQELQPVVDLVVTMKWIASAPDLNGFAAGQPPVPGKGRSRAFPRATSGVIRYRNR